MTRNIVVFVTDDQERGTIEQVMPYLNSNPHGHWVQFPNAAQSTPWCGPCRANLLSGQRSDFNGVDDNDTTPFDWTKSIAVPLAAAGVTTGLVGKSLNSWHGTPAVPSGWTKWFGLSLNSPGEYFYGWTAKNNLSGSIVSEQQTVHYPGAAGYSTDVCRDKAIQIVDQAIGDPLFLYVGFPSPHGPSTPADRHAGVSVPGTDPVDWNEMPTNAPAWLGLPAMGTTTQANTRLYRDEGRRCILSVDEAIEAIIERVDFHGQLDNTIFMFCTDNAYAQGRKRLGKDKDSASKCSPYKYASDGMLRIRHPDATQRVDTRVVDFLDLPATWLAHFGADPIVTMHGTDMAAVITDTATDWRDYIVTCFVGNMKPDPIIPRWWACRSPTWRYGWYYELGQYDLYKVDTDPEERVNVYAANPAVAAEYQAVIDAAIPDPTFTFAHLLDGPTIPTELTATPADGQVGLTWQPSSDNVEVVGYHVYVAGALHDSTSSTSYVVTGLDNGTEYSFAVAAYDGDGNVSPTSATVYATPTATPGGTDLMVIIAGQEYRARVQIGSNVYDDILVEAP